jgi:O-antigen/teichoic acid export membrane protein
LLDLHEKVDSMNGGLSPPSVLLGGFERLRASVMLKQSALVFTAAMVLNVCGFLVHAIASRQLGVATYGAFYALNSSAVIAALPAGFLAPVVAQLAAEFRALHDDGHLRSLTKSVASGFAVLGLLYLLVSLLGAAAFSNFLRVPVWSVPLAGLFAAIVLCLGALRALAQGTQDFLGYSVSNAVEGIGKVVAVAVLLSIGLRLFGAIFGFLLGPVCALIYIGRRLAQRYSRAQPHSIRYDWRRIMNAGAGAAAATITMTLMGSADVVLVKHFFDAHDAGLYAAASLGGKILLYLVGFVPTVLLPQAADRHARGARTREVLVASLLMLAVIALGGLFVFHFFGIDVLHALVGHAYDAAAPLLVTYGAAMILLALTNALTFYGIATHRLAFTVPLLVCTFATLGAIAAIHPSLTTVVEIMVLGNLAAVVAVSVSLIGQRHHTARPRPAA